MEDGDRNYKFTVKIPGKSGQRSERQQPESSRSGDKDEEESMRDEKRRWKAKFEQIQTQLSRSEIQLYDYKLKLNDLVNENANLRTNLEQQIRQLQTQLNGREADYSLLSDAYNELKLKVTDRQSNEPAQSSERTSDRTSDRLSDQTSGRNSDRTSDRISDRISDRTNDRTSDKSNEQAVELIDLNDDLNEPAKGDFNESDRRRCCDASEQLAKLSETNRQLVELNERLREEIKNLECELEEASDKYREDQTNEFKEIKFKLENSVKNCRLLQFKLTKLERAYNQVKVENNHLTNKLKKATELHNLRNRPATPQTEITKTELDKAKEVLLRMHISLQTLKGEKMRLEEQLQLTKNELLAVSLRNSQQNKVAAAVRALSPQSSIDKHLEETIRDLEERESDLQEQLKFSEQQSDSLRRKLSAIEQENEMLTKQIENLMGSTNSTSKGEESSIESIARDNAAKESKEAKAKEFVRQRTGSETRRDSGGSMGESATETSQMSSKVEKVLQKENLKSGSLFKRDYEEKIESLERQLQKIKSDLSDKQQENENLLNMIDMKKKDKFGRRLMRSSSLQD